jgi:hypothetical protein
VKNMGDWLTLIANMEDWLSEYIGEQTVDWEYVNNNQGLEIGFVKPEHTSFFILGFGG